MRTFLVPRPLPRLGILLPVLLLWLCTDCRNRQGTQSVQDRFEELLRPTDAGSAACTAGYARVAADNEIRPVIAQLASLSRLSNVQVQKPGLQTLRTRELDTLANPLPPIHVMVRQGEGLWEPRDASVHETADQRYLGLRLLDADVGRPLDIAVTGWVPPSPLDVRTREFLVPLNTRLRFGMTVKSAAPARADFRLSVDIGGAAAAPMYVHSIESPDDVNGPGWYDVDLPLSAYAGQRIRLRFEATVSALRPEAARVAPPTAVISAPILLAGDTRAEPRYNLVLISIDTLRADHVGAYGYRRPVSPTIDRLATDGTLFENVIAQWPQTDASHMTLFTSLYPSVHGISAPKWGAKVLPPWQLTLAEVFRQFGYATGAITEDGLLMAAEGFPRGFDDYREFPPLTRTGPVLKPNPIDGLPMAARCEGSAEQGFARAADWLRRHREERFFLFLHTYQVHQRTAPGERYAALRATFVDDHVMPEIKRPEDYVGTYDAAIAYTDDKLNGLLRALEALQLTRRTLVIVTSDHGEEFFEHGMFGHGQTVYDPALRVPMIFYCPGLVPAGKRIGAQVGLIDVAPTILELLRLPPLKQAQGRSAAHLVTGSDGADRGPLIGEIGDTVRALRTNAFKLIRTIDASEPHVEFYNLQRDPNESHSIATDSNPQVESALRLLTEHDLESQSVRTQLQAAAAAQEGTPPTELDERTRERLRALGYAVSDGQ